MFHLSGHAHEAVYLYAQVLHSGLPFHLLSPESQLRWHGTLLAGQKGGRLCDIHSDTPLRQLCYLSTSIPSRAVMIFPIWRPGTTTVSGRRPFCHEGRRCVFHLDEEFLRRPPKYPAVCSYIDCTYYIVEPWVDYCMIPRGQIFRDGVESTMRTRLTTLGDDPHPCGSRLYGKIFVQPSLLELIGESLNAPPVLSAIKFCYLSGIPGCLHSPGSS
ncbi:hypothetical protein EVAR_37884_1 [Eumeta japonica]|uniref:Uncharacterized protein n=1 Tax=Eumeta variegata TaxID=151549 RepID=A0A4C1Y809_EUMVA|nr:hypothetical protein EVAR_37884_1 [Eumeta japonica]